MTPEEKQEIDPCDQVVVISPNGLFSIGEFGKENEVDWFAFDGIQDTRYEVSVDIPDDSPADANMDIYSDCVADNIAVESISTRLGFTAPSTGRIYLRLSNNDGSVAGSHVKYRISVDVLPEKKVAIIVAGHPGPNADLQNNIYNAANDVFRMFQTKGFTADDITYLAPANDSVLGTTQSSLFRDDEATVINFSGAITSWAVDKAPDVLNLYMADRGEIDKFYLNDQDEVLSPDQLDDWLNQLESAVPDIEINIFIDASHAGSFIQEPQSISKAGRVIVTSSSQDNIAYASPDSTYFSEHFFTALRGGGNVYESWEKASRNIENIFPKDFQEPWIDGDGNGIYNELSDFTIAAQRHFEQGYTLGDVAPPEIVDAYMEEDDTVVASEVSDDQNIESVWAIIYPPSYLQRTNRNVSTAADSLTIIDLSGGSTEDNIYRGDPYDFAEEGTYRIVVQAKAEDGLVAEPNVMEIKIMDSGFKDNQDNQDNQDTDISQRLYLPFVSQ